MTATETRDEMIRMGKYWCIPLMDFVDEFRRSGNPDMIAQPHDTIHERFDALPASVIEALCNEMKVTVPRWIWSVPSCGKPWFVSGMENLKAIALVESPVWFKVRTIFVLENFLSRV